MSLEEPVLFIILAVVIYAAWVLLNKPRRQISYFGRIIFLTGCVILASYYFLPLPLDRVAFDALTDPLLPLKEAIKINPIAQIIEDKRHLDYYFANLYPIFGGAALIGFSADLSFAKKLPAKKHLLLAFLIPAFIFVFHAAFRLISGSMWKMAESGQILWFMLFYFIGYGVCLFSEKIKNGLSPTDEDD